MGFFVMFFVQLIATAILELISPKPSLENAKPAGIGDFQFPTSSEGRVVPRLWGTSMISGINTVWWGDLAQEPIKIKQKTGLFSSTSQIIGYKYNIGFQFALCRGPAVEILNVQIADKDVHSGLVVDGGTFAINRPNLFGGDELGNGGIVGTLKFHAGSLTQAPSTYLSAHQQVGGDTPGYNGTAYLAPDTERVYVGNSENIKPWKIEARRIPNGLGLITAQAALNGGNDCNPMNVIYEVMTDVEWGLGISSSKIDTTDFATAAATLATEGNGFSFLLDRLERAEEMLERLEQQIDGTIFFNASVGLWQINLARADYDILLVPELNETNIIEIRSFTRGTWAGTSNQFRATFNQRDDKYKETSGFAQDMGNVRIQGMNVSSGETYPGVKDADLANAIAWRQLRTLSFPIATAQIVVDRTFYGTQPGQVYAFTDADAGFVRLPMRVKSIDDGELADGRIVLDLVQDIWFSAAGSFTKPQTTLWTPPLDSLVPFPADQQEAIEAPRALTYRDPDGSGPDVDKLYAWARKQGVEVAFKIVERHSPGVPAGAFVEVGEVFGFALLGELSTGLPRGSAFPQTSVTVVPTPDTQAQMLGSLPAGASDLIELGTDLLTLLAVGDEFMLVSHAQASGGNVQLNSVYRGVLDSVMEDHASGEDVWLVFVGAGISLNTIPTGDQVDIKLLPRSSTDEVAEASATQIPQFEMSDRVRRPYPPSELSLNNTRFATTASLEFTGTGEGDGVDLDFTRRDFRTAEGGDEIAALGVDAATLFTDFPAANNTTHDLEVIDDPDGTPTTLFTQSIGSAATDTITRLDILRFNAGVVPSRMQFRLRSIHDYQSVSYTSTFDLTWDFNVTSALSGLFNFGALDTNIVSASFTVVDGATDHDFTLTSLFTAGAVEYRINGGGWATLIAAGLTTGSIPNASINVSDTIEVRHASFDAGAQKLLTMDVGATPTAYAVLFV